MMRFCLLKYILLYRQWEWKGDGDADMISIRDELFYLTLGFRDMPHGAIIQTVYKLMFQVIIAMVFDLTVLIDQIGSFSYDTLDQPFSPAQDFGLIIVFEVNWYIYISAIWYHELVIRKLV